MLQRSNCRPLTAASLIVIFNLLSLGSLAQSPQPPSVDEPTNLSKSIDAPPPQLSFDTTWDLKRKPGIDPLLILSSDISFVNSDKVIGKADGTRTTLGFNLISGLLVHQGSHELRNNLNASLEFFREPILDEFVKTRDSLDFETLYLYHWPTNVNVGPYARFSLQTSMLEGKDIRPNNVTYSLQHTDGSTTNVNAREFKLTDPLEPILLKEAVGAFIQPLRKVYARSEIRAGFQAQEILADHQYVLADNQATPQIEVHEIATHYQAGPELTALLSGDLGPRIGYKSFADFMLPVVRDQSDTGHKNTWELLNSDFGVDISLKIFKSFSLEYTFRALKEPQLLNQFQIMNALYFRLSWRVLEPPTRNF